MVAKEDFWLVRHTVRHPKYRSNATRGPGVIGFEGDLFRTEKAAIGFCIDHNLPLGRINFLEKGQTL